MRQLWHDIKAHPLSAALFFCFWLAFWVMDWSLGWSSGIPDAAFYVGLLTPMIAAGLVGWWRAPTREGVLVKRRLAGGPLAAVLVILIDVALVYVTDWAGANEGGTWEWFAVVEILLVCAIFCIPFIWLGWIGARIGGALADKARAGATS